MISERKPKTVRIPAETLRPLRKHINSFLSFTDAQEGIGVDRRVLKRLLKEDTCAPETLEQISNYLKATA